MLLFIDFGNIRSRSGYKDKQSDIVEIVNPLTCGKFA